MLSIDQDFTAQDCIDVGCFLASSNRKDKGESFFREALRLEPANAIAMSNIGSLLASGGSIDAGKEMCFAALVADPSSPLAWHTLGKIAQESGNFDEARAFYMSAIRNKPDMPEFWQSLSFNAQYRQQWDEAVEHYKKALEIRPNDANTLMSLGMLYMAQGDMLPGMSLYEQRLKIHNPFPVALPVWDGVSRSLNGKKVLICCEQGIGDSFMLARYGAYLKQVFPKVKLSLFCPDSIRDIMGCWPGFDAVYSAKDVQLPDHDFQIATFSLPWLMNLMDNIRVAPVVAPKIPPRLDIRDGRKRIGVCWRGNPKHVNDKYRSMKLAEMIEILGYSTEMHDYYAFQFDISESEKEFIEPVLADGLRSTLAGWRIPSMGGWVQTAQSLCEMDIVVTVDTAVCHLAASLGVRTWLLLSATCDFRWGLESETTRWYDKVRIFRQEKLGEWGPVIDKVRMALEVAFEEPVYGDL